MISKISISNGRGGSRKGHNVFTEQGVAMLATILIDIFNKAEKELIIIDNYIDKNILDILCKINKKIIIITNKYNNEDFNKYKK